MMKTSSQHIKKGLKILIYRCNKVFYLLRLRYVKKHKYVK